MQIVSIPLHRVLVSNYVYYQLFIREEVYWIYWYYDTSRVLLLNFTVIFIFYLTVKGLYIIVIVLEKGNMVNTLLGYFTRQGTSIYIYQCFRYIWKRVKRVLTNKQLLRAEEIQQLHVSGCRSSPPLDIKIIIQELDKYEINKWEVVYPSGQCAFTPPFGCDIDFFLYQSVQFKTGPFMLIQIMKG